MNQLGGFIHIYHMYQCKMGERLLTGIWWGKEIKAEKLRKGNKRKGDSECIAGPFWPFNIVPCDSWAPGRSLMPCSWVGSGLLTFPWAEYHCLHGMFSHDYSSPSPHPPHIITILLINSQTSIVSCYLEYYIPLFFLFPLLTQTLLGIKDSHKFMFCLSPVMSI